MTRISLLSGATAAELTSCEHVPQVVIWGVRGQVSVAPSICPCFHRIRQTRRLGLGSSQGSSRWSSWSPPRFWPLVRLFHYVYVSILTGYFISVNGSIWVEGGSIEYSDMHEAAPIGCTYIIYGLNWSSWLLWSNNGMVSLAFQPKDQRLIGQVRDYETGHWTIEALADWAQNPSCQMQQSWDSSGHDISRYPRGLSCTPIYSYL